MEVIPGAVLFLLFLWFSFWVGGAMDCAGNNIVHTITVDQQGKGEFTTVQAAIDSIMKFNNRWVKLHINAGTYTEKVEISEYKPCIFLEGAGKEVTTIRSSGYHSTSTIKSSVKNRNENTGAIFVSFPPNVIVIGITFENSFNLMGSQPIQPAPAAAIYGDKSVFLECGFKSYQDTLFDELGRHYFKNCYIQGEVDFIYGGGQSYYEACTINATQEKPSSTGFVTAQSRYSEKDTSGFVFRTGSVTGSGEVNLGRAWGPYSRVIFYGTYFSSIVSPQGWNAWNYRGQESKLTYAEVDCTGPGANTTERVQWRKNLTNSQLNEFSLSSYINKDGWLSNLPIKF
ncbi:putative pectinesterase 10 [Cajanus cajan]|uniref:putative pectinesterase 10 n=1 Tax=Cajanus cajan TaxID=3821 RepID=UPI00098D7857|nr:putative pectinesterase 10 [Cajanus cajan]